MKIGIITLYYKNNNYGGVAQAYALYKYFSNLGYECELITYKKKPSTLNLVNKNKNLKMLINRCKGKIKRISHVPIEKYLSKRYKAKLETRGQKLENFRNSIPHSKVYSLETISEISDKYDIFITGSDQVWNPGVVDQAFVFSFLKNQNKKILSYASSVAVTDVTDKYKDFMKKELEKYGFISVREKSSKDIIQSLTNKNVEWVMDPTLILERKDWEKLTTERIIKEKYIFSYMIGDNKKQKKQIEKFAKQENLLLVTLPYIKNGNRFEFRIEDYKFGDKQMLDITFEDFLSLIKYSEYVITDSFHAICFSYIFKKEFYAFEKGTLVSTNSRIYTLLELFEATNRIVKDKIEKDNTLLDYDKIDINMSRKIEDSKRFLKTALETFNGGNINAE